MLNTPGQDDEDGELDLDFEGLVVDDDGDDCLPLDDERPQVGFELLDWNAEMLDALDDELHARGVPHEWVGDGFEVVAHEDDEATLDSLIAELVAPFLPQVADDAAAEALMADLAAEEPAPSTRDETPVEVVDDLFQSVSRMRRSPDGAPRDAFLDAAERIGSDPPFGVDPTVWGGVVTHVDDLIDALVEGSKDHVVTSRVEDLRRRLRPLI